MTTKIHEAELVLATLARGERYVYHEGFLARDRQFSVVLDHVAKRALEMEGKGKLILCQRRIGPAPKKGEDYSATVHKFQYFAIGR